MIVYKKIQSKFFRIKEFLNNDITVPANKLEVSLYRVNQACHTKVIITSTVPLKSY